MLKYRKRYLNAEAVANTTCDVCSTENIDCFLVKSDKMCLVCFTRECERDAYEPNYSQLTRLDADDVAALAILKKSLKRLNRLKLDRSTQAQKLTEQLANLNDEPRDDLGELTEKIEVLEEQVAAQYPPLKLKWIRWQQSKGKYKGMTPEEHASWRIGISEALAWEEEARPPRLSPKVFGQSGDNVLGPYEHSPEYWQSQIDAEEARKLSNKQRMRRVRAADRRRSQDRDRKRASRAAAAAVKLAKATARKLADKLRKQASRAAKKAGK